MQQGKINITFPARVVLLGFMGAGKSTIGAMLATRLGWTFHDTDEKLVRRTGLTVAELFRLHGESHFRAVEAEMVEGLMDENHAVIALGGGAIETSSTQILLASLPDTCTIFLDAPLEIMLDRCKFSSSVRPLLQDPDSLAQRYARRLPLYRQSTLTLSTDGLSPEAVVERLLARLDEMANPGNSQQREQGKSL